MIPEWLSRGKQDILQGGGTYVPMTLGVELDKLPMEVCDICGGPTIKELSTFSLLSSSKDPVRVIVGTEDMPTYRCTMCSAPWPFLSEIGLSDFYAKAIPIFRRLGALSTAFSLEQGKQLRIGVMR